MRSYCGGVGLEEMIVEEKDGVASLVLGKGIRVEIHGEMSQEGFHLLWPHVFRVALVVKEDKTLDPGDVSLLRADGIALNADDVAGLFKEFGMTLGI